MASSTADAERFCAETRAQWRAWLDGHAADSPGVWLVTWRRGSGRPVLSYEEAVTEALAFGWVDSKGRALDDERTMLWFTRRKRGSGWARTNKRRIAELEAAGLMTVAGRAVVEAARADGSWTLLDDVEDLVVPPDLAAAFDAVPGSREHWEAFPRSAKRALLAWIVQARTAPTRAKRIAQTAEATGRGERADQWRPGATR